ncbi:MAG: glycosyltransferase [Pseudomonadota bacterium]
MKNKVSVIIPVYNRAQHLSKAVNSVLDQSSPAYEIIVVDDGSTDNTSKIIQQYGSKISCLRQENKGPAAARNLGIMNASGELIAFLDSDDWWHKDKLQRQVARMEEEPSFLVSHTDETWYRRGQHLNQKNKHKKYHGYIYDKCLPLCAVSPSTVMARKELFNQIGLFDETLPCCEDYDLWLRVSIQHQFLLIDKPLTLKDGGRPDQVSFIHRIGIDKYRIKSLQKILSTPELLNAEQRSLAFKELEYKCRIYGNGCLKHGKPKEAEFYLGLPTKFRYESALS